MSSLTCPACEAKVRLDELQRHPPEQPDLSRAMGRRFCAQCGCEVVLQERSGVALIVVVLAMLLGYGAFLAFVDPSDWMKGIVTVLAPGALYVWAAAGKRLVKVRDRGDAS